MQVSWIDTAEVSALAESLRNAPAYKRTPHPEESHILTAEDVPIMPLAEETPVADTQAGNLHDFRSKLKAIRERAIQAGLISTQTAPVLSEPVRAEIELPPFLPQTGSVSERLAALALWAQTFLGDSEFFIVGDQGDLIWGQSQQAGLVLSTILARSASTRMSALAAYETAETTRQIMATGLHLAVIPCATRLGIMQVAITSRTPVPQTKISAVSQALIAAMEA